MYFGQAINRKIQEIGLITEYKDRANPFSIMVRKMRALAFLPPELVEEGFEELLAEYYDPIRVILGPERVHLLEMFIAYFQSQWLENQQIAIREWNVSTLESYRTNNHQEGNNYRLSCRITPSIAGNLWTFLKSSMKEQITQSRSLFQFQHGGRFALRRRCYRENEEQIEVLMGDRATGNLDTAHFLDAIYRRIGD